MGSRNRRSVLFIKIKNAIQSWDDNVDCCCRWWVKSRICIFRLPHFFIVLNNEGVTLMHIICEWVSSQSYSLENNNRALIGSGGHIIHEQMYSTRHYHDHRLEFVHNLAFHVHSHLFVWPILTYNELLERFIANHRFHHIKEFTHK